MSNRTGRKKRSNADLFLPHLIEPVPRPWLIHESVLDKAAVDTQHREAWVPTAGTVAQQMARLHEAYHAKVSPRNWFRVVQSVISQGVSEGILLDAKAVLHIGKMLEENRVDWLLWSRHKIDIRACRDSLDWSKLTLPEDDLLESTCWVLQLAWTVWASEGFGKAKVPSPPPVREPDPEAKRFFGACWKIVQTDNDLARAVIRACLTTYNDPSSSTRDDITLELAAFFKVPDVAELPEETADEKEEQEELVQKEKAQQEQETDDEEGGVDNTWVLLKGGVQLHDHTRGQRRPRVVIHKGWRPTDYGFKIRYPHRYTIDKTIFAMRAASEGSLMIDFSGSMKWNNDDLLYLLDKMPEIFVAGYTGVHDTAYYGRICIIAKEGRFNVFTGIDSECNGNNDVDLEALELLAQQPAPRFWLSDGMVTGGKHVGLVSVDNAGKLGPLLTKPFNRLPFTAKSYLGTHADLIMKVNTVMRRAEILRVPDSETMRQLASGKRVVLYRTTFPDQSEPRRMWYGDAIPNTPVKFQL